MAVYLVTGGGGFIGSHLVEELLQRGDTVRVLDNFATGRRSNLEPFLDHIELIDGDMQQYHTVIKAMQGVEFVLHQAALPSVPRSVKDPISSNNVNVVGTLNLLHAAVECGVQRFVYASSSSIYGDTEVSPKVESLPPNPKSPYAVAKFSAESYGRVFYQLYGLQTVSLRYFNVFGPRQDPNSQYAAVLPKFVRAMLKGESPVIFGDGTQTRDFTFVKNNVQANLLACTAEKAPGNVYNIACGAKFSLLDVVEAINKILGTNIEPILNPVRKGDILHSLAGIERAKEDLGYEPKFSFDEGLRILVENFEG